MGQRNKNFQWADRQYACYSELHWMDLWYRPNNRAVRVFFWAQQLYNEIKQDLIPELIPDVVQTFFSDGMKFFFKHDHIVTSNYALPSFIRGKDSIIKAHNKVTTGFLEDRFCHRRPILKKQDGTIGNTYPKGVDNVVFLDKNEAIDFANRNKRKLARYPEVDSGGHRTMLDTPDNWLYTARGRRRYRNYNLPNPKIFVADMETFTENMHNPNNKAYNLLQFAFRIV